MKLEWTKQALDDLAGIDAWLTANVDARAAAETLEKVRRHSHGLLRFPRRKPRIGRARQYSHVERTPYILIYFVRGGVVTVMRIRHVREDWRPR